MSAKLVSDSIDKRLAEGVTRHTVYLVPRHLRQTKAATYLGTLHTPAERVIAPYFTSGHRRKDRWHTPSELTKLLDKLPKRRAALVPLFVATGARLGKAAHIPITKVNEGLLRGSRSSVHRGR